MCAACTRVPRLYIHTRSCARRHTDAHVCSMHTRLSFMHTYSLARVSLINTYSLVRVYAHRRTCVQNAHASPTLICILSRARICAQQTHMSTLTVKEPAPSASSSSHRSTPPLIAQRSRRRSRWPVRKKISKYGVPRACTSAARRGCS